jgi:hypothetical protein
MSITLNSVVYNWAGFDQSGTSRWTATAAGVASAFSNLTARVTFGTSLGKDLRPSRAKWRIQIPVIATEDSACACVGSVLRTSYVDIVTDFAVSATLTERQDVLARIRALVLTTEFGNSLTALTQPAG